MATKAKTQELLDRLRDRRKAFNRAGTRWYDIRDADGAIAEVRIYDEIGWFGTTAEDFVAEINAITAPNIRVAINSPGGDAFDGIAIYNALRAHPAHIITRVDSLAASAASVIAQAGDERVMFESSQMMIHDAWGIAIGNATEFREFADVLEMQDAIIADIYASRSDGEAQAFRDLMDKETWLRASEAVELGLADEVVEPGAQDALAKRTLNDEIREATDVVSTVIESAERVAALRAENGDQLSRVNREGLDGLEQGIERIAALLTGDSKVQEQEPADLSEYRRRVEALSRPTVPDLSRYLRD